MKFRRKPLIVDAEQFFPHKEPWPAGVTYSAVFGHFKIETLEGKLTVTPGDWIITGVKGERYPCKPDIFAQIYELVTTD